MVNLTTGGEAANISATNDGKSRSGGGGVGCVLGGLGVGILGRIRGSGLKKGLGLIRKWAVRVSEPSELLCGIGLYICVL